MWDEVGSGTKDIKSFWEQLHSSTCVVFNNCNHNNKLVT